MRWLAALGLLGACFSPSAPTGLPCGEGQTCPEGQTCDLLTNECGTASSALILRDDTAADFATGTGDATIEPQGFVGATAFFTGGVRVTGYDGALITDLANASIDTLVADHTPTGVAIEHSLRIDYAARNPPGLGIADPDAATLLLEGEVELEVAGAWRFQLTANDRGFLEIAEPGSSSFTRVVEDVDTGTVGTFTATQPGWHRFRIAFQDQAQFLSLDLLYDPPNVTGNGFRDLPSDRIRAPSADLSGLLVDGFELANLLSKQGSLVSTESLQALTLETDAFGLPIGIGAFSLRWSGQFLIDDPGDYVFALDTVHGHRLWIDGQLVADKFLAVAAQSTTSAITLDAGWHDVVLDVTKEGGQGNGSVSWIVESGPQFAGMAIPADHLRPVIGRGARLVTRQNLTALALPDGTGASATRSLSLDLPGSLIQPVDVRTAVEVTSGALATVSLVLDPPVGANLAMIEAGDLTGTGPEIVHLPLDASLSGELWGFIGTDNLADTVASSISAAHVGIVYDGGIAPFAPSSRHESSVRELGDVAGFERIAWTTRRAPDPRAVIVSLRTCDAAPDCATEPYVEVENGTVPDVPTRRFIQYQVELTSDGDVATALDAIELRYVVRGME